MILVPHLLHLPIDNEKSTRMCWWWLSLSWLNPGRQLSPSQPEGWGRELMARHKEFNSKARATQVGNPQKGNPFSTSISHVQESRVLSPINTPLPPLPSALYAEPDVIQYGMSLGSAGLSCPVPVTSQAVHPQPPACWGSTKQAGLSSVGTAQLQQKHPCVTSAVSSTNPQLHSTPVKQINYPS